MGKDKNNEQLNDRPSKRNKNLASSRDESLDAITESLKTTTIRGGKKPSKSSEPSFAERETQKKKDSQDKGEGRG